MWRSRQNRDRLHRTTPSPQKRKKQQQKHKQPTKAYSPQNKHKKQEQKQPTNTSSPKKNTKSKSKVNKHITRSLFNKTNKIMGLLCCRVTDLEVLGGFPPVSGPPDSGGGAARPGASEGDEGFGSPAVRSWASVTCWILGVGKNV